MAAAAAIVRFWLLILLLLEGRRFKFRLLPGGTGCGGNNDRCDIDILLISVGGP